MILDALAGISQKGISQTKGSHTVTVLQMLASPHVDICAIKLKFQKLNSARSQMSSCSFAKTTNLLCPVTTVVPPHQCFNKRDKGGVRGSRS